MAFINAVQARINVNHTLKQGNNRNNLIGIEFSSFNQDHSIQQPQLLLFKQNLTKKSKDTL
jgi:hypothetical protein